MALCMGSKCSPPVHAPCTCAWCEVLQADISAVRPSPKSFALKAHRQAGCERPFKPQAPSRAPTTRRPPSTAPRMRARCEPPDAGAVNVRLEPGLAFGTGEHPTTRLCLRWLHARRSELAGRRVMDYGTGEHPVPWARARGHRVCA